MSKPKKYITTKSFLKAVHSGEFKGRVVIDNDSVNAFVGDDDVFDFQGCGLEMALFVLLTAIGV